MRKLFIVFIILLCCSEQTYSQLVAKVELKEKIEGICDYDEIYYLMQDENQLKALPPISKDEIYKKLNNLNFIKENPKFKSKGTVSLMINCKGEVVECDSQKNLKIVDLTGAGDLFAGGFLHGYINKLSAKESLEKGTEMSSKIIQKIGARLN